MRCSGLAPYLSFRGQGGEAGMRAVLLPDPLSPCFAAGATKSGHNHAFLRRRSDNHDDDQPQHASAAHTFTGWSRRRFGHFFRGCCRLRRCCRNDLLLLLHERRSAPDGPHCHQKLFRIWVFLWQVPKVLFSSNLFDVGAFGQRLRSLRSS